MGGTRAVIASLGAGISIVACAAIGLFAFSVLFPHSGIFDALSGSGSGPTLVVATQVSSASSKPAIRAETTKPLVVTAPKLAAPPAPRRSVPVSHRSSGVRPTTGATQASPSPAAGGSSVPEIAAVTQSPAVSHPASPTPKAGDGVRELGAAVTGTVQNTANALGGATKPLGPPVSKAVQDVLNKAVLAINNLLQRTTGGLAGIVDATKP